jgi:SpoVK/Ycf46/Vps4 family AAA+-type ATPase
VGESAKRIHEIFVRAKEEEAIILFDECESLFAARSAENGRNAAVNRDNNQQTTVLLREIERFNGIILLTSNHIVGDNMDKAFARRIRHHICFEAPTLELRSQIWRKHFPAQAPLADDVDFAVLAETYEFSGGAIKQIALKAAFEAASSTGVITQQMLLDLCEFEVTNNKVGYRKIAAPVGFGR